MLHRFVSSHTVVAVALAFSLTSTPGFGAESEPAQYPAASEAAAAPDPNRPDRGYWFYEVLAKDPEKIMPEPGVHSSEIGVPPPAEDRCRDAKEWTADCGFVDPGEDYDFQAKQRDALLTAMTMKKGDMKAVEAFQWYMKWVMARALEVSEIWTYNLVQNPELDPAFHNPVSALGLQLMTSVKAGQSSDIFKAITDNGGGLVYFSRHSCSFCHAMRYPLLALAEDSGLTIRNASLEGPCIEDFEEGCMSGEETFPAAEALQVTVVPAVFLYVKPNVWIRIANGVTTTEAMKSRVVNFFTAYRSALLKGMKTADGSVPMDFSAVHDSATGNAPGVALPDAEQVKSLFKATARRPD